MPAALYQFTDFSPIIRAKALKASKNVARRIPRNFVLRLPPSEDVPSFSFRVRPLEVAVLPSSSYRVVTASIARADAASDDFQILSVAATEISRQPVPTSAVRFISTLDHQRYTLRKAIPVQIEEADGVLSAWSADLNHFGYGPTEAEALDDFKAGLVDLYAVLVMESEALGPVPQRSLISLREFIIEKP